MADTVNLKLTALANEVRELSATTNAKSIDAMIVDLDDANTEIGTQSDLISQINTALQGKTAGTEQATPIISVNNSTGLITATAGTKSSTHQLTIQPTKTIIPNTTSQIAVNKDVYTTGIVTVEAIPSEYIIPRGTLTITANGIHDVKNYISAEVNMAGGDSPGVNTDIEDGFITNNINTYTNDRVTTIKDYAFYNGTKLTAVNFPGVTTLGSNVFNGCTSLITASIPQLTKIGNNAFASCKTLPTISFPLVTSIGGYAFYNCYLLTSINFPQAKSIGGFAFGYCRSLATAEFAQTTTIPANAFANCWRLSQLTLAASSLCGLANSNAFTSTPIGGYSASTGTYGSIYVPASLLTQYQSATNWTYFSSRFVGI